MASAKLNFENLFLAMRELQWNIHRPNCFLSSMSDSVNCLEVRTAHIYRSALNKSLGVLWLCAWWNERACRGLIWCHWDEYSSKLKSLSLPLTRLNSTRVALRSDWKSSKQTNICTRIFRKLHVIPQHGLFTSLSDSISMTAINSESLLPSEKGSTFIVYCQCLNIPCAR